MERLFTGFIVLLFLTLVITAITELIKDVGLLTLLIVIGVIIVSYFVGWTCDKLYEKEYKIRK